MRQEKDIIAACPHFSVDSRRFVRNEDLNLDGHAILLFRRMNERFAYPAPEAIIEEQ